MEKTFRDTLIKWVVGLGAIGLSFYFMLTESGLFRYLAAFQQEHLFNGSYYPKYTFLLTFLIIFLPLALILSFFGVKMLD